MEQNKEALQNLTLRNMFLPGTHNSAAYLESDVPFYDTFVQRYTFNQVSNTWVYASFELRLYDYFSPQKLKHIGHNSLLNKIYRYPEHPIQVLGWFLRGLTLPQQSRVINL